MGYTSPNARNFSIPQLLSLSLQVISGQSGDGDASTLPLSNDHSVGSREPSKPSTRLVLCLHGHSRSPITLRRQQQQQQTPSIPWTTHHTHSGRSSRHGSNQCTHFILAPVAHAFVYSVAVDFPRALPSFERWRWCWVRITSMQQQYFVYDPPVIYSNSMARNLSRLSSQPSEPGGGDLFGAFLDAELTPEPSAAGCWPP